MTPSEIKAASAALASASPPEILKWASDAFAPRLTFATGFGPEGLVLLDLIAGQKLPVDVFTLDTGLLFEETQRLWQQLEARYGVTIRAVRPAQSVAEQAAEHGEALWERDPDRCCELRKVVPLRQALAGFDAWVTALRRDQTANRASAQPVEWDAKFGLVKVNPLFAWTANDVWDHVKSHRVPYNPLHDQGYASIGCRPCTTAVAPGEDPRAGRWRGKAKTECGIHLNPRSAPKKDDHVSR